MLTRVYVHCAHSCVYCDMCMCSGAHAYVLTHVDALCSCVHAHSYGYTLCTHMYMLTRVSIHRAHVCVPVHACMCSRVCTYTLCTRVCAPVHMCTCSLMCVGALVLWSELPFLQHLLVRWKQPEVIPLRALPTQQVHTASTPVTRPPSAPGLRGEEEDPLKPGPVWGGSSGSVGAQGPAVGGA